LVKAGRGSKGRREAGREVARRVSLLANFGEEKNSQNNPLSSPASRSLSEPYWEDKKVKS